MPQIQQLDPHVADLIAAGEVVERPASVVKELMENAIDAGARSLTVEIQNGGMTLIRCTDDGCGMAPEDAEIAFLRHATSKIRNEYDLEAIGTLGFRGEALAAITAVSRIGLLTRRAEDALGASVSLEGGVVTELEEAGCPAGTTLVVRDLFFNTPARLKFMKKDAAEGAACFACVQRTALSHPEVAVKFLRDGRQELLTPGDGQLQSAVYAVLGRDLALGLTPVKGSGEELSVSGFASLPTCCRGTRGYQFFFVNGRFVKSRTMMAAVEEAYQNQKMVGKFPGCVIHLTAKLSAVDVNVHPTKQEVKFGSDKRVFDAVYYAVKAALEQDHTRPAALSEPIKPLDTVTPNQTILQPPPLSRHVGKGEVMELHDFTASTPAPREAGGGYRLPFQRPTTTPAPPPPKITRMTTAAAECATPPAAVTLPEAPSRPESPAPPPVVVEASSPSAAPTPPPDPEEVPWRLAGEVLHTYIIVEQGDSILLIDKHAAHERLNFDRLKAQGYTPMVQTLLTPLVFTPPAEEGAALLAHLALLVAFGFEAEDFGGGAIVVRAAPDEVAVGEIESTLCTLAQELITTGRADPSAARDALLHTMACKAAIKGGQKNSPQELERVARAVLSGAVKYCPHGRPVAITLARAQLEKRFGRA